ncbi:MAG TPA: hypothetical protein VGM18_13520 [Candidatus Sulfotelmatobacter sp.]
MGENGETRHIPIRSGENSNSIIEREAKKPKAEGYWKVPASKLQGLVIQYPIDGMGDVNDLDKTRQS